MHQQAPEKTIVRPQVNLPLHHVHKRFGADMMANMYLLCSHHHRRSWLMLATDTLHSGGSTQTRPKNFGARCDLQFHQILFNLNQTKIMENIGLASFSSDQISTRTGTYRQIVFTIWDMMGQHASQQKKLNKCFAFA